MTYKLDPQKTSLSIGGKKIESQELIDNSVDAPSCGTGTLSIKYSDILRFVDANRERLESNPDGTLNVHVKAPNVPDGQRIQIRGVLSK
jgi:hypothetical protein